MGPGGGFQSLRFEGLHYSNSYLSDSPWVIMYLPLPVGTLLELRAILICDIYHKPDKEKPESETRRKKKPLKNKVIDTA